MGIPIRASPLRLNRIAHSEFLRHIKPRERAKDFRLGLDGWTWRRRLCPAEKPNRGLLDAFQVNAIDRMRRCDRQSVFQAGLRHRDKEMSALPFALPGIA